MKEYLITPSLFIGILTFLATMVTAQRIASENQTNQTKDLQQVNQLFASQGLRFAENRGQVADLDCKLRPDILFTAQNEGVKLFLTANGIYYQFRRDYLKPAQKAVKFEMDEADSTQFYRLDVSLKGANPNPKVIKAGEGVDIENFFLPHCPNGITGVKNYNRITYKEVYPNIDWVVNVKEGMLEYDFVVRPGGNIDDIKLQYKGAEKLALDKTGALHLTTPLGTVTEQKPFSFQQEGREVESRFVLEDNMVGFVVPEYNENEILTIDPWVDWATYYGASGTDGGYAVATDVDGNVYLGGPTGSTSGISSGGHQNTYAGSTDGFLVKFNAQGVRQWATYYGGTGEESVHAITIDKSNNIYIAGITFSSSGIAFNGHQNLFGGGQDGYLVKFNAQGVRQWATYYGGSGLDRAYVLATDESGNVYMTGITGSSTDIASGGHQNVFGGLQDAYLVKFNTQGVRQWSTYYGGTSREIGLGLVTDQSGNIYLSGETRSSSGISSGGHQNTYGGGDNDGFLAKFNPNGIRQWATYYGGSGSETVRAAAIDGNDNIYLVGETSSLSAIASDGYQNTNGGGSYDAFLVKFNIEGVRQWATYYGADGADYGYAVATDANGDVFLGGGTVSNTGIASNGIQNTLAGGQDAFLAKFNPQGPRLWGTYYGGLADDFGYAATTDKFGNLFLAGYTFSSEGIATEGHQLFYGGSRDAFLAKITDTAPTDTDGDGVSDANDCAPDDNTKYRTANLYIDKDGDGYDAGQENVCYGATNPSGYKSTTLGSDCDDDNADVTSLNWYRDEDNDGYSNGTTLTQCTQPSGYKLAANLTATSGDCNDNDAAINPGASELADGKDNDCDGLIDEDFTTQAEYRSKANGNWTQLATWEKKNSNGIFVAATNIPSGPGDIVSITHEVLLNRNLSLENLVIQSTGHLTIGSYTLTLLDNISQSELFVYGKLTMSFSNSRISSGKIEVTGEIVNNGVISSVTLCNGTSIQSLGGNGYFTSSLTLNNASGLNITTGRPSVKNLIFESGIIYANPGTAIDVNTISGYGPGKFVEGTLGRIFEYFYDDNGGGGFLPGPFFFPVGLNGIYLPVNVIPAEVEYNATGTETHIIGVEVVAGPPPASDLPEAIGEISDVRHIKITHGGSYPVITYFNLEMYTAPMDEIDNLERAVMVGKNSSNWEVIFTWVHPDRIVGEYCGGGDPIFKSTEFYVIAKKAYYLQCPSDKVVNIPIGQTSTAVNGLQAIILPSDPGFTINIYADGATDFSTTGDPSGSIFNLGITNLDYSASISSYLWTECDTKITVVAANKYCRDADGDSFGDPNNFIYSQNPSPPSGYVINSNDCDDTNYNINPVATEVCDGKDNDCDSQIDEGCGCPVWFYDADSDGYGVTTKTMVSCTKPKGKWVSVSGDCKPTDATVNPGASEIADGKDNDCDGVIDEGFTCPTWYYDADGDGYGIHNKTVINSCAKPNGKWVLLAGDCKPTDATVYPGVSEICDGKDNNCNGLIDEGCDLITDKGSTRPAVKGEVEGGKLKARIYPNPARTDFIVSLDEFVPNQKVELVLMTADGRRLKAQSLIPSVKGHQLKFDVKGYSSGNYLLLINQGALNVTKRVIILR